jgi:GH15 family glucan-1,4-alpha-glucosidase
MTSTPHANSPGHRPDPALRALARRCVEIIAEHQDAGGAYIASPVFPVYRYSWLRDGAFIADAMSRAGEIDSAEAFFGWCTNVVVDRADRIRSLVGRAARGEPVPHSDQLPARFTLDGAEVGEEWWDFQLDGYGTWMWALHAHAQRHERSTAAYLPAVDLCAEYLAAFWAEPCYDWWEEHADGVHPSTLAAVAAGLRAATAMGVANRAGDVVAAIGDVVQGAGIVDGHLVKTIGAGTAVDASLLSCAVPFGVVEPGGEVAEGTYRAVVDQLGPDGVHRYRVDTYFGGGRWVLLAGLVGWYEAVTGRHGEALRRLIWMHDQADAAGHLPEQVSDHAFDRSFIEVWEQRWGPVARPLLWSQAMYIILADELGLLDES